MIRRILRAIEPWYDYGAVETNSIKMLCDKSAGRFGDETLGEVRFFTLQWLGLHLHFEIGRTPTNREAGACGPMPTSPTNESFAR